MAKSITRCVALTLGMAVLAAAPPLWHDAPEHAAIFVPAIQRDFYSVAVTSAGLEDVLASLAADEKVVRAPGAWQARDENAQDVFGTGGAYNRWQLARLYGSRTARVARGARMDRGRVVEAWTLVSPYPSPDLRTLQPGTMRLILKVAP